MNRKATASWLILCCALVFSTLVQGGVTRLTHSGLSIVEWKPVTGVVPPLTAAQWSEEFSKYQATPEYKLVNAGMSLGEFKSIFWMEWAHRLLARTTALAILGPLCALALARRIEKGFGGRFAAIGALIALQGVLGWYMVYSGLIRDPHVSHYRLTAHLITATALYAVMFWTALDLAWGAAPSGARAGLRRLSTAFVTLIFVAMTAGGLVAGLQAGFLQDAVPVLGGRLIPPHLFGSGPVLRSFIDNRATVLFDHVLLGLATGAFAVLVWIKAQRADLPPRAKVGAHLVLVAAFFQILLGILTVAYVVPPPMASAHQANALLLLTAGLFLRHELA